MLNCIRFYEYIYGEHLQKGFIRLDSKQLIVIDDI